MNKATLDSLILSIIVSAISTIGGACVAQKIAGGDAGFKYFWFGCFISLVITMPQILIFPRAKRRLFFQLNYLGFFGFTIAWFILALSLPIFWMSEIGATEKLILLVILISFMSFNFALGWRMFNKSWSNTGIAAFKTEFKGFLPDGDWNKVIKNLRLEHYIAIPGISKKWASAFSVLLLALMLTGLSLRTVYPTFSVFAWGIPSIVMASYFIQVSGSYFAQAAQVKRLEADLGDVLNSTS